LIEVSEHHKHEVEKEVRSLSDKTEKMIINGLIIGGSPGHYLLYYQPMGRVEVKKKKAKTKERELETEADDVLVAPL